MEILLVGTVVHGWGTDDLQLLSDRAYVRFWGLISFEFDWGGVKIPSGMHDDMLVKIFSLVRHQPRRSEMGIDNQCSQECVRKSKGGTLTAIRHWSSLS